MTMGVQTKKEYIEKTKNKTDEWITRLALLDAHAREMGENVRIKCELRFWDFRMLLDVFQAELIKIKKAGDTYWGEQHKGLADAFSSLEDSFERAVLGCQKVMDENAPLGVHDSSDEDEWDH